MKTLLFGLLLAFVYDILFKLLGGEMQPGFSLIFGAIGGLQARIINKE